MKTFWTVYTIVAIIMFMILLVLTVKYNVKNEKYELWYDPVITFIITLVCGILWPLYLVFNAVMVAKRKRAKTQYEELLNWIPKKEAL